MGDTEAAHGLNFQFKFYYGTEQTSTTFFSQHHQLFIINLKIYLTLITSSKFR